MLCNVTGGDSLACHRNAPALHHATLFGQHDDDSGDHAMIADKPTSVQRSEHAGEHR
jgi:hypothetical protein